MNETTQGLPMTVVGQPHHIVDHVWSDEVDRNWANTQAHAR